jgi:hypothetical protein
MKVGDLVTMPGQTLSEGEKPSVGIVVEPPSRQQTPRVGVLWADGEGVDWEPACWLEVINESR